MTTKKERNEIEQNECKINTNENMCARKIPCDSQQNAQAIKNKLKKKKRNKSTTATQLKCDA